MPPKRRIVLPHDQSLMGEEYQKRIQEVDPDLLITHHRVTGWSVWREEADERGTFYRPIARQRVPDAPFNINKLVADLKSRDTHHGPSHTERMEQYLRDIEREEADKEAAAVEALRPVYDKLRYQAARLDGVSKTFFAFPDKVE